ncbi:hypothetical protein P7C70_g6138, partial [Phenoliferia sp. Uapishka_3]
MSSKEEGTYYEKRSDQEEAGTVTVLEVDVNASGHTDALERQYGLFAICSTALAIDSAWMAMGGSIVVAIYNGGSPGVLYELTFVSSLAVKLISSNEYSGYSSNGVAFLTGVLNGFTIGTPDAITHMAEELPNPRVDLPKAIFAQMALGTITSFVYGIALMYSISDLPSILSSTANFPVELFQAAIYLQATNNNAAATTGLLFMFLLARPHLAHVSRARATTAQSFSAKSCKLSPQLDEAGHVVAAKI